MNLRYRSIIAGLGAFVMLGGLFALAFALATEGPERWRGIAGALVALAVGSGLAIAALTGWMPDWLRRLLDI